MGLLQAHWLTCADHGVDEGEPDFDLNTSKCDDGASGDGSWVEEEEAEGSASGQQEEQEVLHMSEDEGDDAGAGAFLMNA